MKEENNLDLKNLDISGNILFNETEGYSLIKLDSNVYSPDAVKFAAHHLADELNIIIDSDAVKRISVELFVKDKSKNIKDLFWKFNDALIAYSTYLIQSDRNAALREAIIKKALSTNEP